MSKTSRKANGQGHTYKIKGTNSYRTVYRVPGGVVTATAKDRQTSRALAKAKYDNAPGSKESNKTRSTNMTLGEFMTRWLTFEHKDEIAHTTYRRYVSLNKVWIEPALGNVLLRNLDKKDIKNLLISMHKAGQSPRSRQQTRALLCVALEAATLANLITKNPVKDVPNVHLVKKPIKPLTSNEVKVLLNSAKGTFMEARLHIAVLCGLRQGEALGLRWSDIDFDKKLITVTHQIQTINGIKTFVKLKTSSSVRSLALASSTLEALKSHRQIIENLKNAQGNKWEENDLLFPNRIGKPMEAGVDYDRWHAALDKCGIQRRNLHNARHTAGTLLYENNVGIETIRRILGHSSVLITSNTYVHNAEKPLRAAAATLDTFLSDGEAA